MSAGGTPVASQRNPWEEIMKYVLGAAAAAAIAFGASPALANCDDGEMVIKFSHVVAEKGHPKGEAAVLFAQRVNDEMNGTACMEVYPNTTLYDDDKVMEALLLGDVQIAAPSLSKFEAYTLKYRVFDLPFLSDTGKGLLSVMEGEGYTGLGYWLSGLKQFSANKPLEVPSDANGLKFRIQTSDVADAMIQAIGGSAQKLAFKEVYGALQTGVVDGQENSWCNIYTQKFFEVQDGISETNHQVLAYLLVTSTEWLEGLDPAVRDQFVKIADEVTLAANADVANKEGACRQNILDAGGAIRELTPEQRSEWVSTMKPVWDQFEGDIGKDVIDAAVAAGS
jgi:C4-dicarboxylate-binding protein DctP